MSNRCPKADRGLIQCTRWPALVLAALTLGLVAEAQEIGLLEPPRPDMSRETIKRLIAENAYSQAEHELDRLLLTSPGDHELMVLQAFTYFHEHRYIESRQIVAALTVSRSATAEVKVLSGLLYVIANDLRSAEAEFQTAVVLDERNAAAHYYLGRTLYMRQDIDGSIAEFERSISLDPKFIQAYDAIGLAYFVKENPSRAQQWFLRGMEQEKLGGGKKMEWLRLDLSSMLLTYHRAAEAAVYLAEAKSLNATNPQVYLELGQMYFQERRYPDALASYAQVLKLDPSNALAHYFRGRAYHLLKDDERAAEEFQRFTTLNRQHDMGVGLMSPLNNVRFDAGGQLNKSNR